MIPVLLGIYRYALLVVIVVLFLEESSSSSSSSFEARWDGDVYGKGHVKDVGSARNVY